MKTLILLLLPFFLHAQTNQTAYLQKLINSGNNVTIPPGVYFTQQLHLHSNLTIHATGVKLSMIQGNYDNTMVSLWQVNNVRITGLELALNGIAGNIWDGTAAVTIFGCNNVVIDSCFIHDNTYIGIRLTGGNSNMHILHNTIQNTDTGVHCNNENHNLTITGNIIEWGTSEGVTIYGYKPGNEPSNFLIDSNIILNKAGSFGINIPFARLGTITHNTISNCLGGIMLHDTVSTGSDIVFTSRINIANNSISNTTYGIIYLGDSCTATNNFISNIQFNGIEAGYSIRLTTGVTISANTILNTALAGGSRGAILITNLQRSNIKNNTARGPGFALRMDGTVQGVNVVWK